MTRRTLAVVTAGLSQPSSTRLLADGLAEATTRALREHGVQVSSDVLELREHAHDLTDHLLTGFPSPALRRAIEGVARADAVIAVTPIFSASFSSLFKAFVDVLEPDVLAGTPVLIGATGGTERHSLALEHAVRPLFVYLRSVVVPTAVYAASSDWAGTADQGLARRMDRAGRELADLITRRPASGPVDPFDDPTSFEELLRGT